MPYGYSTNSKNHRRNNDSNYPGAEKLRAIGLDPSRFRYTSEGHFENVWAPTHTSAVTDRYTAQCKDSLIKHHAKDWLAYKLQASLSIFIKNKGG